VVPPRNLRAIVFDVGGVLVRIDVGRAMADLAFGLSLSPSELWTAIQNDPRWPDWQEGRISPRDWHLHLTRRLGTTLAFEQFIAAWNHALDPQPVQDDALFETLCETYRLGLLSNTDPIHIAHLESTYGFVRFFPASARIYSCVVGASKPSPLLYLEALRACKVQASEAAYVDDVLPNVEAARNLGLAGIHYQSPEALVRDLTQLGVKLK
jgi:HAD superfamily hydrolase (TIGR01509 family)